MANTVFPPVTRSLRCHDPDLAPVVIIPAVITVWHHPAIRNLPYQEEVHAPAAITQAEITVSPVTKDLQVSGAFKEDATWGARIKRMFGGLNEDGALASTPAGAGNTPGVDWVLSEDIDLTPAWERIPGSSLAKRWAQEVSTALNAKTIADWSLIGTSISLFHQDLRECGLVARRAALEAGLKFISISPERLNDSVRGLRLALEALAPVMVLLKPGPWCGQGEAGGDAGSDPDKTIDLLEQELRGFHPERPVFFVVCAQSVQDIPRQLLSVGAIDRAIRVSLPDAAFLAQDFVNLLGVQVTGESLVEHPLKLGAFLRENLLHRRRRERGALILRRQAKRERRRIEFSDLVDLVLRGFTETEAEPSPRDLAEIRKRVAYHEAGHAIVAVLASGGRAIPEYASIVPSSEFRGVVMESVSYLDTHSEMTYEELQYRVRVGLGGRAAEEFVLGPAGVGAGAISDLQNATGLATWLFSQAGFAPDMGTPGISSSNLAVATGDLSALAEMRVGRMVRRFLSQEYDIVMKLLADNEKFLSAVADRLMWDPIVDQEEMALIATAQGVDISRHEDLQALRI